MNTNENAAPEVKPNPKRAFWFTCFGGVAIFFLTLPIIGWLTLAYYVFFPSPPSAEVLQARADKELAHQCRAHIITQLKNPESFQNMGTSTIRNKTIPKTNGGSIQADVVVVSFTASNSFGGSLKKNGLCVYEPGGGKLIEMVILDK